MARPKSQDFLHNFRFHVIITAYGGANLLHSAVAPSGIPSAGFSACTAPEVTQEAVTYREGHYIYTRKYVGLPGVNDLTLSRGVALGDGSFWAWLRSCIVENAEYRADLEIRHLHRNAKPQADSLPPAMQIPETSVPGTDSDAAVTYHCYNCFPIRHKVSGDFDATSSDVSVQELDIAFEQFDMKVGTAAT